MHEQALIVGAPRDECVDGSGKRGVDRIRQGLPFGIEPVNAAEVIRVLHPDHPRWLSGPDDSQTHERICVFSRLRRVESDASAGMWLASSRA